MKIITLMENTALDAHLACEHGLSLYIELETENHGTRRLLFDMGQSDALLSNAKALGVDLSQVDTAVLSHGHYDHGGGLQAFFSVNHRAPVYVQRTAFAGHYSGGYERYIGLDPALRPYVESGRIRLTDDETDLGDGVSLVSCNAMKAEYPASVRGMLLEKDSMLVQDTFRHEQYMIIREGGKKIVLSGCSHKGVLNIVQWLQPDVLIGGFHFMKMDPEGEDRQILLDAAAALLAHDAEYYTCHCTGLAAYDVLHERMGDRLAYLAAGSSIEI